MLSRRHLVRQHILERRVYCNIALLGPKKVDLDNVTATSVQVTFTPPDDSSNIDEYEASVKGGTANQACNVKSTATPLQCLINGLSVAEQYTIEAICCTVSPRRCSSPIEKSFWTNPYG